MFRETMNRLERLHKSVRQGQQVLEAKDFCSWLQFSGYCKVFDLCPSKEKHFEVDGRAVRKKIDDIIYDCGEWFRSGKVSPKYAESDIAEINAKLDRLLDAKKFTDGLGAIENAAERYSDSEHQVRPVVVRPNRSSRAN